MYGDGVVASLFWEKMNEKAVELKMVDVQERRNEDVVCAKKGRCECELD